MIIKAVLIIVTSAIVIYFLSNKNSVKVRAYKKIGVLLLMILAVFSILFPNSLNKIAHAFDVGRGADLLLYALFLGSTLFALNVYLKFQEQETTIHRLARKIAIIEAAEELHEKTNTKK